MCVSLCVALDLLALDLQTRLPCPGTQRSPASAPRVLGIKMCTTTAQPPVILIMHIYVSVWVYVDMCVGACGDQRPWFLLELEFRASGR